MKKVQILVFYRAMDKVKTQVAKFETGHQLVEDLVKKIATEGFSSKAELSSNGEVREYSVLHSPASIQEVFYYIRTPEDLHLMSWADALDAAVNATSIKDRTKYHLRAMFFYSDRIACEEGSFTCQPRFDPALIQIKEERKLFGFTEWITAIRRGQVDLTIFRGIGPKTAQTIKDDLDAWVSTIEKDA